MIYTHTHIYVYPYIRSYLAVMNSDMSRWMLFAIKSLLLFCPFHDIPCIFLKGGVHQFSSRVMEISLDGRNANNTWRKKGATKGPLPSCFKGFSALCRALYSPFDRVRYSVKRPDTKWFEFLSSRQIPSRLMKIGELPLKLKKVYGTLKTISVMIS